MSMEQPPQSTRQLFGKQVKVILNPPLQDPIEYEIIGYKISLRREEADDIEVVSEKGARTLYISKVRNFLLMLLAVRMRIFLKKKWNVWRPNGIIRYEWHWSAILIVEKPPCSTSLPGHTSMSGTIAV